MRTLPASHWLVILLLALIAGCQIAVSGADDAETPAGIKGVKVVSTDEVKAMIDSVDTYDLRNALSFAQGRLPGAIQLSGQWRSENSRDADLSLDELDLAKLPGDKNAKVIFYSDGTKGWKSYKAALIAARAGYKNVLWMRGGYNDWVGKGYPLER